MLNPHSDSEMSVSSFRQTRASQSCSDPWTTQDSLSSTRQETEGESWLLFHLLFVNQGKNIRGWQETGGFLAVDENSNKCFPERRGILARSSAVEQNKLMRFGKVIKTPESCDQLPLTPCVSFQITKDNYAYLWNHEFYFDFGRKFAYIRISNYSLTYTETTLIILGFTF